MSDQAREALPTLEVAVEELAAELDASKGLEVFVELPQDTAGVLLAALRSPMEPRERGDSATCPCGLLYPVKSLHPDAPVGGGGQDRLAPTEGEREPDYKAFARWAFENSVLDGYDLDGGSAQDKLAALGIIVLGPADPDTNEWGADVLYYWHENPIVRAPQGAPEPMP